MINENLAEKTYDVWMEGFVCTGESSKAHFVGSVKAETFKKACDKLFNNDILYDPINLTHWGCRLYDNEADARKSFG